MGLKLMEEVSMKVLKQPLGKLVRDLLSSQLNGADLDKAEAAVNKAVGK